MKLHRSGILVRLSYFVVIQVLFVFSVLAIVMFFPSSEETTVYDFQSQQHRFQKLVENIQLEFEENQWYPQCAQCDSNLTTDLLQLFIPDTKLSSVEIYYESGEGSLVPLFMYYDSKDSVIPLLPFGAAVAGSVSGPELSKLITQPTGVFLPHTLGSRESVYTLRFDINNNIPALLVGVSSDDLLVSSRSELGYMLLILFLCSVLVSLLIVYLLFSRFRDPLMVLQEGLKKMTEGEFHRIAPQGDSTLDKMIRSINEVSGKFLDSRECLGQKDILLKEAKNARDESQTFLATLIDNSPSCVIAASKAGKIVLFNRKASEVFGYDSSDIIGEDIDRLFLGSIGDDIDNRTGSNIGSEREIVCRRADGSQFPSYLVSSIVKDASGSITTKLYNILDISESKDFQDMMVQLDRYFTQGRMAGDIAHEINNYLAVLSGNIELMPLFLKKNDHDKITKKLELMKTTVDRITRFADGLSNIDHGETSFAPTDINQLLQNMLAFLGPQNRFDGVEFRSELSPELPLVEIDATQIQQTLVNLLNNAADAIHDIEGEKIIIATTGIVDNDEGRNFHIDISDNGPGISDDHLDKLFVKRFTTRRRGRGFGLITCGKIVESHGGKIGYEYADGAHFCIKIPVCHKPIAETEDVSVQSSQ